MKQLLLMLTTFFSVISYCFASSNDFSDAKAIYNALNIQEKDAYDSGSYSHNLFIKEKEVNGYICRFKKGKDGSESYYCKIDLRYGNLDTEILYKALDLPEVPISNDSSGVATSIKKVGNLSCKKYLIDGEEAFTCAEHQENGENLNICNRQPRVRDAILYALDHFSPLNPEGCVFVTKDDLKKIKSLYINLRPSSVPLSDADLQGLDGLEQISFDFMTGTKEPDTPKLIGLKNFFPVNTNIKSIRLMGPGNYVSFQPGFFDNIKETQDIRFFLFEPNFLPKNWHKFLKNTKTLELYGANLKYFFNNKVFETFKELQTLEVTDGTDFEFDKEIYFPSDFSDNLKNLVNLKISMKSPCPPCIKESLEFHEDSFNNFTKLQKLEIYFVHIPEISENLFRNMEELEFISIRGSDIDKMMGAPFQNLRSLKRLDLNADKISMHGESLFHGLTNLESLNLSGASEYIQFTDTFFNSLTNLKDLHMGNHSPLIWPIIPRRTSYEIPPKLFYPLKSLEKLNLAWIDNISLADNSFVNQTKLTALILCGHGRHVPFSDKLFEPLRSIKILHTGSDYKRCPTDPFEDPFDYGSW